MQAGEAQRLRDRVHESAMLKRLLPEAHANMPTQKCAGEDTPAPEIRRQMIRVLFSAPHGSEYRTSWLVGLAHSVAVHSMPARSRSNWTRKTQRFARVRPYGLSVLENGSHKRQPL